MINTNGKPDPYVICPTYESEHFLLRLVKPEDAPDLLECYKNATVSVDGNSINCTFGYGAQTLAEMSECVGLWLDAYKGRGFIRLSIVAKASGKTVGTVEIFGSEPGGFSVLRIDNTAEYETESYLSELVKIADSFFGDVGCESMITRAMPEAKIRAAVLAANGYVPFPVTDAWDGEYFYIKSRM